MTTSPTRIGATGFGNWIHLRHRNRGSARRVLHLSKRGSAKSRSGEFESASGCGCGPVNGEQQGFWLGSSCMNSTRTSSGSYRLS